ncbi:short-chain dehydrogenase [Rossellomorea marisflavi]|jgi:NAD(P)-dependent dehydrogenase (short-subunit alcohol dehydrogenase family)|uniref:Short-chain dehydrogenase n=1 Tax=Rossellomorea marisflavi TaxID=189381 RepID=A0A0M0G065_9BACI|nr:SDR family NAD(P)-dependent oxidoreductase [Rossellomorea marisflavi]VXB43753.1 Short-chain dehydrogenase [Bacillus sp. 349Y]KON83163.1 short-chain dehydrogenase [Rossellomorea marisflavi]MCM2589880.1 SDR family oxidoreductase [Rossellomorea marisflavi]MDR4935008.1 SDR family NAD(P)-dependent oxidoreductase [Rossellomorea marisflavi]UTE73111.1 SDR family oxidoreductase [Rossellomorea marisflavi]
MSELKGQVVVVTGGASGIGKEAALQLSGKGASVVVADFNESGAKEVAEQINQAGGSAAHYKVDVSKGEEIKALIDWTAEKFGTFNGIFNNAGIGLVKPFLEMDPESYHRVIDVDQHSVYYGMYYGAKKMVELGATGTIVNTASIYGTAAAVGSFNYNAAKAAVVMMSKSGALELAEHGIRVVGVAPGFIDTPILGDDQEAKDYLAGQHMRGELIKPEKVASVVTFLFTDAASAINGQTIPVEDGFLSYKIR